MVPGLQQLLEGPDAPLIGAAVVRDYGVAEALGSTALFQAGSISKAITALIAVELAARGEVDLDADINTQLRSWRLPGDRVVTLAQVLSHTAGIGVPFFPGYAQGTGLPTLAQVLDGEAPAATAPVRAEHDAGAFRYSGGGYAIVQQLLMDVTGQRFEELAEVVVLRPLGMVSSTFEQPLPPERRQSAARKDWRAYPESAAVGLWTTPVDLARFIAAIQRGHAGLAGPVTRETARAMLTPRATLPLEGDWAVLPTLGVRPPDRSGLGLFLEGADRFSHLGGAANFFSILTGSIGDGDGGVVMSAAGASTVIFEVARLLSEHYGWRGFAA